MLNRISVNGTELEYELRGTGGEEPVVLIHWGVAATWAEPLLDQQALASRYHTDARLSSAPTSWSRSWLRSVPADLGMDASRRAS